MGTLFIVATPIGNREDITVRAIKMLFSVDVILCEDTRKTGSLLHSYQSDEMVGKMVQIILPGIILRKPRLVSFYDEVEEEKIPEVIALLKEGKSIALVSDAGTPLVSDPGFKLVRACIREGIPVSPIPGPSSVIAALSISGLPIDKFLYLGYLSQKEKKREETLQYVKALEQNGLVKTVILLESPHRIRKTLEAVKKTLGDTHVVLARELTKIHEEILRGTISEVLPRLESPKGEFTVIISAT